MRTPLLDSLQSTKSSNECRSERVDFFSHLYDRKIKVFYDQAKGVKKWKSREPFDQQVC